MDNDDGRNNHNKQHISYGSLSIWEEDILSPYVANAANGGHQSRYKLRISELTLLKLRLLLIGSYGALKTSYAVRPLQGDLVVIPHGSYAK